MDSTSSKNGSWKDRPVKKILRHELYGRMGRTRLKQVEDVENDLQEMNMMATKGSGQTGIGI
jgi:hypothetical protein